MYMAALPIILLLGNMVLLTETLFIGTANRQKTTASAKMADAAILYKQNLQYEYILTMYSKRIKMKKGKMQKMQRWAGLFDSPFLIIL